MNTPQNPYPCGNCLHIYATPDVAPCADCREDLTAQPVRFTGFVDWRTEVERLRAELAALRAQEPVARPAQTLTDDDLRDMADSACQEALAYGVGIDAFMKLARSVAKRAAPQPAAAPAGELIGYLEFGTDQPRTPVYAKQEPAEKRTDWSAS